MPPRQAPSSAEASDTQNLQSERLESLANGLALLRVFAEGTPSLTVQEAAQQLGMTRAAARRLLITLQLEGYLRCEGNLYYVTPRVMDLGFAYYASMSLPQLAHTTLQSLGDQVAEACSLGVWDNGHVVIVARHEPARMLRVNVDIGRRLPAFAHSMGRVLLANQMVAAQRAHLKAHAPQAFTKETVTDKTQLLQIFQQVAQQGWCVLTGELAEGFCGISVPIRGSGGKVLAALSITMVQGRRTEHDLQTDYLPKLQAAAAQLEALVHGRERFHGFNF
ncbi:MAG: helix-turn-helix domain-containing protein [Comamonas sp.]|jgi:IclR family pca regulon transcriptional regulator|uniref:IclR family transcriptional regulator domain-containing protein n=1 Tax=Comamonas sp. TaxID=34028 RepID=UPI00281C4FB0|nr:IclR family transcriptional regulator C-terminal domain-containing protein [Comamonas sp.]MDR0217260.1 helix-turn-helix domain-containing protein [Comamonas sp.]